MFRFLPNMVRRFLGNERSMAKRPAPRRKPRFRPQLLQFEDRVVPSATVVAETENNDISVNADSLPAVSGLVIATGAVSQAGDVDVYRVSAGSGDRIWALVDTSSASGNKDSVLRLFRTAGGTTTLETDDDDGPGAGSLIAGAPTDFGAVPYYLEVKDFQGGGGNGDNPITSYNLFTRVVNGNGIFESETNSTIATANPIGEASSVLRRGNTGGSDVDMYKFDARAGDRVMVATSADPFRDGSGAGVNYEVLDRNGATVLASGSTSSSGTSPGNGLIFAVPADGTYYVKVTAISSGTYSLLVAGNSPLPTTPAQPSVTGAQIITKNVRGVKRYYVKATLSNGTTRTIKSPLQRPTRNIQAAVHDANGDGVAESVLVTGLRGKRKISRVVTV